MQRIRRASVGASIIVPPPPPPAPAAAPGTGGKLRNPRGLRNITDVRG
jgi:hypothetical protein